MEKTLTQLVLLTGKKYHEIKELEEKTNLIYDDLDDIKTEIFERFCPKQWVGQEFKISQDRSDNYPYDTLNWMDKGVLPHQKWKVPKLSDYHKGRMFKCDFVRLVTVAVNEKGHNIIWQMVGKIQLKSGEYGKENFTFDFVDKVEIEK